MGTLHVVDLDADQQVEVVMVTNGGRIVVASVADGTVHWSTEIMSDVSAPAFADVTGDGKLDVIVSTRGRFAVGLSGTNGAEVWNSGEQLSGASAAHPGSRLVAVTTSQMGRLIIAGNDQISAGLRAMAVNKTKGNE